MSKPLFPDLKLARRCADLLKAFPPGAPEHNRIAILGGLAAGVAQADLARQLRISRAAVSKQARRAAELGPDEFLVRSRGATPRVRLGAVMTEIERHPAITTAALADRLGCSVRTVMRVRARLKS